jgi:phenylalanyl-tRNA synthetase beta chain
LIGDIHPIVAQNYECGKETVAAYLFIDVLVKNSSDEMNVKPLPKFPAITRDIAMVVDDEITVAKIEGIIKNKAGQIFESLKLFDVYKGEQMQKGTKSIAYSIVFRSPARTLTDDEVSTTMGNIYKALKDKLGAELR